jgi:type IV secretory pathway protease TraF
MRHSVLPRLALLLVLSALAAILARPLRWEIDGLSMAPGLMPGDIVRSASFPSLDTLWPPRRFERFVVQASDGSVGIKRMAGLPGERLSIADGDLAIDGEVVLTPPSVLAEIASPLPAREERRPDGSIRLVIEQQPLDDAPFAPAERRVLLPVRDVGLGVVIHADKSDACLRLTIGERIARFTLPAAGRCMLVAGRLDGRFVAAAWPLASSGCKPEGTRSGLSGQPPAAWQLVSPWVGATPTDAPLILECREETSRADGRVSVEKAFAWRDILHRPAADQIVEWRLGPREFFVLGDFPSGSRDSRQWGAISRDRILHRATSATRPQAP